MKNKNMKVLVLILSICIACFKSQAQKFGYIDSEYIIAKMPEYKTATDAMNQFADKWTKDLQAKYDDLEKLKQKYQQEEILLTAEMRKEKQSEIELKEDALKKLNNDIFGINGMLFLKKKEVLKPIMEDIYKSSEKIARKYKLSFIFDKASDLSMIYSDPRHDYTDYLIEDLGLNLKKVK